MLTLWGPQMRYGLWRQLWLALAESQQALGIDIPDGALAAMRAHLDSVRSHIKLQSDKKYESADKLTTPEFVLLFICTSNARL